MGFAAQTAVVREAAAQVAAAAQAAVAGLQEPVRSVRERPRIASRVPPNFIASHAVAHGKSSEIKVL